ncbi:hypothetical protein UlMin_030102 [Ulmus minor]
MTTAGAVSPQKYSFRNFLKSFQYKVERDSEVEVRNTLLIVTALIAAVTFQAGINPPGGVWQDTEKGNNTAGTAILSTKTKPAYAAFICSNTFPFYQEIWLAAFTMVISYVSAVIALTPDLPGSRLFLFTFVVPLGLRYLTYEDEKEAEAQAEAVE